MAEEASAYAAAVAESMGWSVSMCSRTGSGREQGVQAAVTDQGRCYADEGEEVLGLAFMAPVEPAAVGQPGRVSASLKRHSDARGRLLVPPYGQEAVRHGKFTRWPLSQPP
ncbi:hypothetical protein [Streptomyces bottropensis]